MTEGMPALASHAAYAHCPKCGQAPLPQDQSFPAACPRCGVIFAKVGQSPVRRTRNKEADAADASADGWLARFGHVPERVDATAFWLRVALLAAFAGWGLVLIRLDYRDGEMAQAFLHRPLLVFHEAGHLVFRAFGEWVSVLGGTLGQLLLPLVLMVALLRKPDPFGAAIGLWFLGVSVLDIAPYMYDALHPQLMLLSGTTGEEGGHDWIYLFRSMGLLTRAQRIGGLTHTLGALVIMVALGWAGWVLRKQHPRIAAEVLHEE
ncbi:MAG: zinc ribbon domain-containing protein [Burkholderiaceae bacterium]